MMFEWLYLGTIFSLYIGVDSGSCPSYCLHDSTCTQLSIDNARCDCTIGFTGARCRKNGMTALRLEIDALSSVSATEAKAYTEKVQSIIQDHMLHEFELGISMKEMNTILRLIAHKMETKKMSEGGNDVDLYPLTEDYVSVLTYIITILNTKGCAVHQTVNCTLNETEYASILDNAEENIYKITNVLLSVKSKDKDGQQITIDKADFVSLTVLKSKGKDLPFEFPSTYGSVILPYWETFQDTIGGKEICVNILSYVRSPYGYVNNTKTVDSGILKVVITDKNGDKTNLNDLDDPVDMTIDMSKIFSATTTWEDMEKLEDGRSLVVAYINTTYEAYVVEFDIQSQLKCVVYGIFGKSRYPTAIKHNIAVKTKGFNQIISKKPKDLPITFQNQKLQITIYNTKLDVGGIMDPLVLTLSCEDDIARRKKRQLTSVHQARIQEIAVYSLNGVIWEKPSYTQLNKADGNFVKFKSTFFSTFASNSLFLPPSMIDFDSLFANFLDRLSSTPHVLATFVVLFGLIAIFTVFLRRKDQNDSFSWEFLHLIDNKTGDGQRYCISVFTGIRSSRYITSMPYFKLDGELNTTGDRILHDGRRENFGSGTCNNFILATKYYLGPLTKLTLWIDNKGNSPDWMVSKVLVVDLKTDEKYVFLCGDWLSERYGKCETWSVMEPLTTDLLNSETIFTDASRRGFFDTHLWFSILKRPNFSRFTRVQRLWSVVALLFLSMIASAMWYNQEPSEDTMTDEEIEANSIQSVKLGPFSLNYRQLYVGLMSSVITFLPSLVIITIFKKRQLKGERFQQYIEENEKEREDKKNPRVLPWWSVFFAYGLIILCILVPGTFTFLYSLEFGPDKTNDWMCSFVFGTVLGVAVLEPIKVLLLAIVIGCCLSKSTERLSDLGDHYRRKNEDESMINTTVIYCPCPSVNDHKEDYRRKKKFFKLDNELMSNFKFWISCIAYTFVLAMICSHNITTKAFWQNQAVKSTIYDTFKPNSTEDIWTWIETYYIPAIWAKRHSNQQLRTAYEQRFTYDGYGYRMSLVQIRQVRSGGSCSGPDAIKDTVTQCTNAYDVETESTNNFCPGWIPYNISCFDENEVTDYSFLYKPSSESKGSTYQGEYGVYGGGGYMMQLGPKQSLTLSFVTTLRNVSWIDGDTRAIFLESNTFNANSRLFSHLKVVIEISQFGAISMTVSCRSSNLYPYVYSLDYIILCLQLVFVVVVVIKMIRFGMGIFKLKSKCCTTFGMWVTLTEIILSLLSIIAFILRIDKTIKAVDEINSGEGDFVSFEDVEKFDYMYRLCIAGVFFIIILRLLKPLSFNYHLYILQNSLNRCRGELLSYIIILTIANMAFASYLYLTVGKLVEDFKDLLTSMKTLLQMLLSMVSFRFNVQMSSIHAQIIVTVFAFTISMIGINIFIGILTWNFYYVKVHGSCDEKDETKQFNHELNLHFWRRLEELLRRVIPSFKKKEDHLCLSKRLEKVYNRYDAIARDEVQWFVMASTVLLAGKRRSAPASLSCCKSKNNGGTLYRYYEMNTQKTHLLLHLPFVKLEDAPDINCYLISMNSKSVNRLNIPFKEFAKSSLYEFIPQDNVTPVKFGAKLTYRCCSVHPEDIIAVKHNSKTWEYRIPREFDSLKLFSCNLDALPTQTFVIQRQEYQKIDIWDLDRYPDIERHRLLITGRFIQLKSDPRITIAIPANSSDKHGDFVTLVERPFGLLCPILQLYSTRAVSGPVDVCLPIFHDQSNGPNCELWVMIRESNGFWGKAKCRLEPSYNQMKVRLSEIKMKTPTAICIKEVSLPWKPDPKSGQEIKFAKEISDISKKRGVQLNWRTLAQKCSVPITSRFEYQKSGSISIHNRVYAFTMDKCVLKRITSPPMGDEEKCLIILSLWLKNLPTTHHVTSLIPLLKNNVNYLTAWTQNNKFETWTQTLDPI